MVNYYTFRIITHFEAQKELAKKNDKSAQPLWTKATSSIFDALRGQTMKLTDNDSVLNAFKR